jgi:hypothetical protein
MAKQNINVGTTANDKKGDSLRAAFQKVNANFTELYTELGLVNDVTLSLGAFEFASSTISTTDSTPIVIDQSVTVSSDLTVGGDILPQTANGGDLGSSTLPWRSLYVSNNTIYIGGTAVGIDANGQLTVSGSQVTGGGGGSTLVNSTKTVSLGSDGTLTVPAGGRISAASGYNLTLGDGLLLGQGGSIFNENEDGLYLGGQNSDAGTYIQIPGRTASENGESMLINHNWENASIDFSNYGGLWSFDSDGSLLIPGKIRVDEYLTRSNLTAYDQTSGYGLAGGPNAFSILQSAWPTANIDINVGAEITSPTFNTATVTSPVIEGPTSTWIIPIGTSNATAFTSTVDITYVVNKTWTFGNNGSITFPDATIQSTAWTGFSVAADDSTQRLISSGELVKFIGAGGITTSSDAEGNITITGSGGGGSTLVNGANTASLGSDGALTIPGDIKSNSNINIEVNLTDSTKRIWQFGEDGNLILPAGGIIAAPDDQSLTLQVNGVEQLEGGGTGDTFVGGTITMDPVSGLSISARDLLGNQLYSLAEVDWTTAVWINGGGSGYANFTGAQDLQNWWTSNGSGAKAASFIEVSINGGARIPAVYNGTNGSASGVSITTTTLPPTDPTTITTFEIFYQFKSSIDIDYDNNDLLIRAEQIGIQIESTEEFLLRSIGNNPINIQTNYGEGGPGNTWQFGANGNLTLPQGTLLGYSDPGGFIIDGAVDKDIAIYTYSGADAHGWTFGTDGSLTLPIGVSIDSSVSALYPKIIADSGKLFSVQGQGSTGSAALAWSLNPNTDTQYAAVGVNKGGGDDLAKVVLTAGNTTATLKVWKFDQTGAFTFPDGTIQTTAAAPAFGFSVAADDSTQRAISNNELIKFIGAGGITTASDAEGNITITGSGGGSVSSLVNGAYTVSLGSTGTLTVPASGIITTTNNEFFKLQAKDSNSLLRNEIKLDPNNGTYMSVWSEEVETSYNTSDWATASWINEDGLGAARFTGAEDLQAFWTTGPGSIVESVEVSINGGARGLAGYENNNGGGYGVYLSVDQVPPGGHGTTVPITSLVFYYRTKNRIDIDRDGGQLLLATQYLTINLETNSYINLKSTRHNPVRIITNNNTHMWEFDSTGSLTLPREGKIYGIGDGGLGGNRYGYISWDGESSGDGSGFNTMRLVPDLQGPEAADTYIILDPAYVDGETGSIHIRAGGTRDNSLADLCLGGANSQVKIGAGLNPPVTVKANNNSWIFGTDGDLTVPGDIKSTANTSIIIDGGVLFANVTVQTVDSFGGGVWRMFISSSAYPTVGTVVQVGDTATTAWGTPVTVTITSIVQDIGAGTWALHTNQDITTGFFFGPGTQTITINSTQVKTWTFSTDKSLTFPDGTKQTTAAQAFSFSVAADDSTQRAVSNNELIKFIGAGGITTSSDAEGNITINGSGGGAYTAETFNTDQITLVGNRITTTVTNANLELECNGTGGVVINTVAEATTASTARSVGYLGIPASTVTTTATLTIADAGEHIYLTTTSNTITIPANASVAYPIGTTLTFIAGPSATITTIAITSDTLRLAGSTSTGTRTLAANGMATAVKVASTLWYINGIGLT